jgi:outer membrane protein assembly factor BamB
MRVPGVAMFKLLKDAARVPARQAGDTAWRRTVAGAAVCMLAACSSAAAATVQSTSPGSLDRSVVAPKHPAAAWPEFGKNAAHTGVAAGLPAAGKLTTRWTATLDGAVYGQPLVVGNLVIAATENDSVYALSESTGKVVWHRRLGAPVPQSALNGCGDIFPLGITGTPIYDQANGLVYAVAEISPGYQHILFGLSVTNGLVKVKRAVLITSAANSPEYNQQRPALAITDGRVYVSFGGLFGNCGPHIGSVVGVPLSGKGALVSYFTPTTRQGAVWGSAGPVLGPDGDFWVGIANGEATAPPYDGSDAVIRLTPTLKRIDLFAPSTWADDNASDFDLGSTQPVLAAGNATFIMGKRGVGYLLNTLHLGGIGGQLAQLAICVAKGAASVNGSSVYEPCDSGGMAAISVSAAKRTIKVLWRGPSNSNGSPVVGGGAIWVTAWNFSGTAAGTLYELNPATGAVRQQISIPGGLPHFSAPTLVGRTVFLGTLHGVTAINGA